VGVKYWNWRKVVKKRGLAPPRRLKMFYGKFKTSFAFIHFQLTVACFLLYQHPYEKFSLKDMHEYSCDLLAKIYTEKFQRICFRSNRHGTGLNIIVQQKLPKFLIATNQNPFGEFMSN
jgi:hypothetical protein